MDLTIRICGSAGDGSLAAGQIFNRAAAQMGCHILNFDSYPAEVRGFGKSAAHTRISDHPVFTPGEGFDCLVALNPLHAAEELKGLKEKGALVCDINALGSLAVQPPQRGYGVPLRDLSFQITKDGRMRNLVALGCVAWLFGMDREAFVKAIRTHFGSKTKAITENCLAAFAAGYAYAAEHLEKAASIPMRSKRSGQKVEILSGNEAAARACLDAGITLFAGYPITPATKILEVLAKALPGRQGVVVQTEDEISALAHVLGGGFAGKRCATATSGPGLALMVELLNLGVMAEVPAVVIDCQRAGPSTGIPTKTEQSDLNLAVFGASGDAFKPVLAPANVEECYALVLKSFEVAECFQTPVLVLMDGYLASRMEALDWKQVRPERFGTFPQRLAEPGSNGYQRYQITLDGISPRALPGMKGRMHVATGLEHDERGRPNYGGEMHEKMAAKRQKKLEGLVQRWADPEVFGGKGKLDVGVIAWGSTIGAAKEAITLLSQQGCSIGGLFPSLLWPVQVQPLQAFSKRCRTLVAAEMNSSGQYLGILERVLHRDIFGVRRVCAEPMSASSLAKEVYAASAVA